jgi:divalent metal cation (Fe/Co/Zn/Cd) transporter
MVFESYSLSVAWKQFQRSRESPNLWTAIRKTKDAVIVTVLLEDSAALAGLVVAAIGIGIGHLTGNPVFDGAASIVIGVILAAVALLLAAESRGLLVGESADKEMLSQIRHVAERDPDVERVLKALTMHLGPHDVLLNLDMLFRSGISADELTDAIDRVERRLREEVPAVNRIFVEARSVAEQAGKARAAAASR